ncbi:acety-l/propionyl-CoA carboxylase subunit alpha [Kitasatospora sp. NBC_01287]|uniref:acetyl/propionyl/methylcrotonyl-CoA carboxylase subunit alpha n=1 Tax=Kitasatospora sp. NBC_01287 TaxID=2903573 RepID=UPI00225C30F6|nr:biotin carboxylase N-terminal domain-containing protein [Kitasatospora sp. NBC_01287]MCX4744675.1 acety-l/propionyl-CoA carboxylase subunit alpha [Kitasatospora sp. NBC_01287]
MISTLLVANRGEIARRVFRSCRELGIATVAVYADPDADAPHVREADLAVRLPGAAPADTYLRADLLVRAALAAGADAVHPGYGFLSEDPAFARAVLAAGLTWVGPSPEAMAAMGSKSAAKRLMAEAGVPVLAPVDPGAAAAADLPLLVKAAAGGGGRGMRVIRELDALAAELAAAAAEAAAAFGDGEVFLEPYLPGGRHVEVQLLADTHGTVWALGERDCSVQRRHQKVIEETPAPGLEPRLRERLAGAATAAARAIGYTGAGTAEFLLAPDGRFFFLEMNTRLQVEHPVTECVTGLDLVALQLAVAEGEALPAEPPAPTGHAIEARLYAEDPAADWQPQSGTLHLVEFPSEQDGPHGRLRIDSGVESGSTVGVHYDAMLAKVIAWAPTRAAAARRLAAALARTRIHGLTTNRDLLVRVLRHPAFLAGELSTAFLAEHGSALLPAADKRELPLAALAAALADAAARPGPLPSGWRNLPSQPQIKRYRADEAGELTVRYRHTRDGLRAEEHPGVRLLAAAGHQVTLELDGLSRDFRVAAYGPAIEVDTPSGSFSLTALPRFPEPVEQLAPGALLAPMPGTVVRLAAAVGERVAAGQPLLWLEAMKMEHQVTAPVDGTVTELRVTTGRQVDLGTLLAVLEPDPEPDPDPAPGTPAPGTPAPGTPETDS